MADGVVFFKNEGFMANVLTGNGYKLDNNGKVVFNSIKSPEFHTENVYLVPANKIVEQHTVYIENLVNARLNLPPRITYIGKDEIEEEGMNLFRLFKKKDDIENFFRIGK
ncbi:hypothetical protein [Fusobacterium sp. PH5-44]|uniref:hypothetical protein n=1 Tax=unclassified Fusobacterium TaxID=2648384 RepID=UPI003D1EE006